MFALNCTNLMKIIIKKNTCNTCNKNNTVIKLYLFLNLYYT